MNSRMNNKGFSMVELIIVIAIMAILAGAIAPTLVKYVNKSRMSSDLNNAKTIGEAAQMALVEKEIADYIFAQTLPYTVDVASLNSNDVFEAFILETISSAPKLKYTKNGATSFEITVYAGNEANSEYYIEVTAKGAAATDVQSKTGDAMLYPDVDGSYQED